jgi:hypothetical protein
LKARCPKLEAQRPKLDTRSSLLDAQNSKANPPPHSVIPELSYRESQSSTPEARYSQLITQNSKANPPPHPSFPSCLIGNLKAQRPKPDTRSSLLKTRRQTRLPTRHSRVVLSGISTLEAGKRKGLKARCATLEARNSKLNARSPILAAHYSKLEILSFLVA